MNKAVIRGLNMAKPKAQSNKEHIEKLKASGGKTFQILLTKDDVKRVEDFKKRHGLLTNKQMLNFLLDYKLVGLNHCMRVLPDEPNQDYGDCVIHDGKKYRIYMTPEFGGMCIDDDTGEMFPTP